MLRLALITCFVLSIKTTETSPETKELESKNEENQTLTELIPLYLTVDYHTGNVYFIGQIVGLIGCEAFILRKNSNEPELVPGLGNGRKAFGIDQKNGIVYIAAENGINIYDDATKTTTDLNYTTNHDIIYMDLADDGKTIYYINAESKKTHKLSVDLKTPPEEVTFLNDAEGLTIDHRNNIYYTHNNIPYVVKAGQTKRSLITEGGKDIRVQDFAVDRDGVVMGISKEGFVCTINPDEAKATKIGKANLPGDATTLAVEADGNLYIGYKYGLIRVKKL